MSETGAPFTLIPPRSRETPVLVEVPHAGLTLDPLSLALCAAPARAVGRDADLYVDDLFSQAPDEGAHLLRAGLSRYVCDLNRDENDFDDQTSLGGTAPSSPHGVVWRKTTEGRPALLSPLAASEVERRLALIHRPYHATIRELLEEKRRRFGFAILLCGHSMPSFGRLGERRADVVPGSRGGTSTDRAVLRATEAAAAAAGYDVAHDAPYRGGFSTLHYGCPGGQVHALQIELARRLYMDERSLAKTDTFDRCALFCRDLVARLGRLDL